MDKAARKKNDQYLKRVNSFNSTIQKVQSLVDLKVLRFDPLNAKVFVNPFCLSSLATDQNRINYVHNLSSYYIVKYWEVFRKDLQAIVAPKTPDYKFTVVDQNTGEPIAKYINDKAVELL